MMLILPFPRGETPSGPTTPPASADDARLVMIRVKVGCGDERSRISPTDPVKPTPMPTPPAPLPAPRPASPTYRTPPGPNARPRGLFKPVATGVTCPYATA